MTYPRQDRTCPLSARQSDDYIDEEIVKVFFQAQHIRRRRRLRNLAVPAPVDRPGRSFADLARVGQPLRRGIFRDMLRAARSR